MLQCVVLLLSNFCQKFYDFDGCNLRHFRRCLKRNGKAGEKIVNSRNLVFLEDVNQHIV